MIQTESKHKNASELFIAVGEKTRLKIVGLCFKNKQTVDQLLRQTGIEKTLLSKHLKVLRDAKILISEKVGREVIYAINQKVCHKLQKNALSLHCCDIILKDLD